MQYELLTHRGLQPENVESMELLYFYSKYKKEREDSAKVPSNPRRTKAY